MKFTSAKYLASIVISYHSPRKSTQLVLSKAHIRKKKEKKSKSTRDTGCKKRVRINTLGAPHTLLASILPR